MSIKEWYEPECSSCGTYHCSSLHCTKCIAEFVFWIKEKGIDLNKARSKKKDWIKAIRETEANIQTLFKQFQEDSGVSKNGHWVFLGDVLAKEKSLRGD